MLPSRCMLGSKPNLKKFLFVMTDKSKYFESQKRQTRSKITLGSNIQHVQGSCINVAEACNTHDIVKKEYNGETNHASSKEVKTSTLHKNVKRRIKKEKIEIKYETDYDNVNSVKKEKWEPPQWRDQLKNMFEMRKVRDAPVDSMGCDVISDVTAKPEVYRYQVLLSLMLSSQTKDQITSAAMSRLRGHGCTIDNILKTDDATLGQLIYPVGFWRRKVEYIKKTSKILMDQYNSDIPNTVETLCKLPGVGPKMAYLVMKCAWNEIHGIGVDTHVNRISNRLGWHKKETKQPEDTRKSLEDWLPRELWSEINHLMVGFGQQTCLPVGPKCFVCLNTSICPFGRSYKSPKKSPKKEIKKEELG